MKAHEKETLVSKLEEVARFLEGADIESEVTADRLMVRPESRCALKLGCLQFTCGHAAQQLRAAIDAYLTPKRARKAA